MKLQDLDMKKNKKKTKKLNMNNLQRKMKF